MKKIMTRPSLMFLASILCSIPCWYFLQFSALYLSYLYLPLARWIFYIGNLLIFILSIKFYKNTKNSSYKLPLFFSLGIMLYFPAEIFLIFLGLYFNRVR